MAREFDVGSARRSATAGHWKERVYTSRKDAKIAKGDGTSSFFLCVLGGLARGSFGCGQRPCRASLRHGVSARGDYVEFFIDSVRQARISGTTDWQGLSFTITGSGTHTLKWRYTKNAWGTGGSD